jgi:hypothetical protein
VPIGGGGEGGGGLGYAVHPYLIGGSKYWVEETPPALVKTPKKNVDGMDAALSPDKIISLPIRQVTKLL